jgi:hypothetical protein
MLEPESRREYYKDLGFQLNDLVNKASKIWPLKPAGIHRLAGGLRGLSSAFLNTSDIDHNFSFGRLLRKTNPVMIFTF